MRQAIFHITTAGWSVRVSCVWEMRPDLWTQFSLQACFLAMFSGKLAAEVVRQSQAANDDGKGRIVVYEKRFNAAIPNFTGEMVENFYTTPFMEIFLEPRERFDLASAVVNAVLAGELEGGWSMRWRIAPIFSGSSNCKPAGRWCRRISFS